MRRRLVLYVSAMALGVAALVAIRSFGINLERAVEEQSREVFGSDLEIRRSNAFSQDAQALIDSLAEVTGAAVVREASFPSMARFPQPGADARTRLVQIRALDGPYPLYGAAETTPASAARQLGRDTTGALVDATLLLQMEATVGDSVQIGGRTYPIVGQVDWGAGADRHRRISGPARLPPARRARLDALGVREPRPLRRRVPVRRRARAGWRRPCPRSTGRTCGTRRPARSSRRCPRRPATSLAFCRSSGSWRCSWAGSAWRRR